MKEVGNEPLEAARLESDHGVDRSLVYQERWAESGLDVALTNVERIKRSLIRAAEMLRESESSEACPFFIHCVDGLERFLETVMITRAALRLDFNRIEVDGLPLSQIESEFTSILASVLECQEKQNFSGIADIVEYELLTNLCSWARALRQLQLSRQSSA